MPSRRTEALLAAAIALAAGVFAAPAAAEPGAKAPTTAARDEAGLAFKEGTKLAAETKWAEALAAFERAERLVPHAITLFDVGVCERALGRYTAARKTFEEALVEDASGRTTLPDRLRQDAKGYLEEMGKLLARVDVQVDPAEATLTVDGRPLVARKRGSEGATVFVAGLAAPGPGGAVPGGRFELEMDSGRHVLTFSRPGHADAIVARDFRPGRAPVLRLALDELPATIDVSADQPGALVTVAGRDLGPAPVSVLRPAGSYRVLVQKDGFVPAEARLVVKAGEASSFQARLPAEKPSIVTRWWFWAIAAGVATGVGVGTYFATQKDVPPERATVGGGSLGFRVNVP
jgi:hypothetical protein